MIHPAFSACMRIAIVMLSVSGCADRKVANPTDAGTDDPSGAASESGAGAESGAEVGSGTLAATDGMGFDPYPDCRGQFGLPPDTDRPACSASIGAAEVSAYPDICQACMCIRDCDDDQDCPSPPTRPEADVRCVTLPSSAKSCLIACEIDADCPPEMRCLASNSGYDDPPARVCVYAISQLECWDE